VVIVRKNNLEKNMSIESEKKLDWVNMCKTCTAQQITGFSHSSEGLYKKSSKQGHTVEHI